MTLKDQILLYEIAIGIMLMILLGLGTYTVNLHGDYSKIKSQSNKIITCYLKLHDKVVAGLLAEEQVPPELLKADIKDLESDIRDLLSLSLPRNDRIFLELTLKLVNTLYRDIHELPGRDMFSALHLDLDSLGGFLLEFTQSAGEGAARTLALCRQAAFFTLCTMVLGLIGALVLFQRKVTDPILNLVRQIKQVSAGKRVNIMGGAGSEEIRELYSAINEVFHAKMNALNELERHNRILDAVREVSSAMLKVNDQQRLLDNICRALLANHDYCLVWVASRSSTEEEIIPLAAACTASKDNEACLNMIFRIKWNLSLKNPVMEAIKRKRPVIVRHALNRREEPPCKLYCPDAHADAAIVALPLFWEDHSFGVLLIHSCVPYAFSKKEVELLHKVAVDLSLALYSIEIRQRLELERDLSREVIETAGAIMISISPQGKILTFNSEAEKVTGFSRNEAIGKNWTEIISFDGEGSGESDAFKTLQDQLKVVNLQGTIQCKDGSKRIINWHSSVMPNIDRGHVAIVFIGIDITEQKLTDLALDQAKADWEQIFHAIQDPIIIVDVNGRIIEANPATMAAARRPREEIIGKGVCEVLEGGGAPGTTRSLELLLKKGKREVIEAKLPGLNGDYLLTVSPVPGPGGVVSRTILVARDMTEEKMRRAEAIRAAQLASVGELAAGVAHEINNPINGIINYAQVLKDEVQIGSMGNEILSRIIKESERIAAIVTNLLSFARQKEETAQTVFITDVIEDSVSLVNHQILKDGIILDIDIPRDLPPIKGKAQELQQVFLNLLSNARYALNQRFPGRDSNKRIRITSKIVSLPTGDYVRTEVTDWGTGIPEDVLDRLFDPFFSTKPPGEGTGLGLSISQRLVREHQGFLTIESEFGGYTTVFVDLPVDRENSAGPDGNDGK